MWITRMPFQVGRSIPLSQAPPAARRSQNPDGLRHRVDHDIPAIPWLRDARSRWRARRMVDGRFSGNGLAIPFVEKAEVPDHERVRSDLEWTGLGQRSSMSTAPSSTRTTSTVIAWFRVIWGVRPDSP